MHRWRNDAVLVASLAFLLMAGPLYAADTPTALEQAIAAYADQRGPFAPDLQEDLRQFYQAREGALVWYEQEERQEAFAEALQEASKHGLQPLDYPFQSLSRAYTSRPPTERFSGDVLLTATVMHYMHDLNVGRIAPGKIDSTLFLLPQNRDLVTPMQQALAHSPGKVSRFMHSLAPNHPQYALLREKLAHFRALKKNHQWPTIPIGELIHAGEEDPRIPAIRRRLIALGMMPPPESRTVPFYPSEPKRETSKPTNTHYDEAMVEAVRDYQKRRNAKIDGVIGPETLRALNLPIDVRIRQLIMAMERWRWLPEDLGEAYALVNIAGFYAKGMDEGQEAVRTPVIVGKTAHETPVFSSHITNIKLYPDWTVPHSIAQRYVLEKLQKKPSLISKMGYEIYRDGKHIPWEDVALQELTTQDFPPYRFRQRPGLNNALGTVRFSIDNHYAIFMHDTPDTHLFDHEQRSFSSGCIRVAKPVAFAQFLLNQQPNPELNRVSSKLNPPPKATLRSKTYPLSNPIPVHLTYMTAWVDDQETVHFEKDIYGRDDRLWASLQKDVPYASAKKGENHATYTNPSLF